jgi:hypothetical protein
LWDFDKPYRHAGRALGTGTQIGVSLGVALAHRGTGRLVVDIQPDGDLMLDAGALWTAATNNIPFLIVMYNNRAYYNDWEHQIHVAEHRGTPVERARIGQDITGPEPDFATSSTWARHRSRSSGGGASTSNASLICLSRCAAFRCAASRCAASRCAASLCAASAWTSSGLRRCRPRAKGRTG